MKGRKIVLGMGVLCLFCAAVFWTSLHRSPDVYTDWDLLEDTVGAAASKTLTCTSADGGTSEFYLTENALLSFYAENQAEFEVDITLQKRDWNGKWHDAAINGEEVLTVSKDSGKTVKNGQYEKGAYRFQGSGSKGPAYDYTVTVCVAEPL